MMTRWAVPIAILCTLLFNIHLIKAEIDCYGASVEVSVFNTTTDHNAPADTTPKNRFYYGYPAALGIPLNASATPHIPLELPTPPDACSDNITPPTQPNAAALTLRGNCTFEEKLQALHAAGYSSMLLYNNDTSADECIVMYGSPNSTDILPMYVVSLTNTAGELLKQQLDQGGVALTVTLRQPVQGMFDPAEVLLFTMAVGTVIVGSLWAGVDLKRFIRLGGRGSGGSGRNDGSSGGDTTGGDNAAEITVHAAISFVFVSSAVLLLLYFFLSQWLAVFLVFMFTLIGWQATTDVVYTVLLYVAPSTWRTTAATLNIPGVGRTPLLVALSATLGGSLSATWFAFRHTHWAWMLQDFISICLMLVILKTVKIPNLKVATILLPSALLYDVWWVFIQPLVTNSASVMVEVATAGGPTERLPMLLAVPVFWGLGTNKAVTVLGLGDVVLPGLLVAFLRRWEVTRSVKPTTYFLPACCGYGAGLIVTYFALALGVGGQQGQPALLYLVPCTLGVVVVLAWRRREVGAMWLCRLPDGSSSSNGGGGEGRVSRSDEGEEDVEEARAALLQGNASSESL